jgi:hypothetical protein
MSEPKFEFRLCQPEDAPIVAKYVAENPQIDLADIQAGLKQNNPTAVYFCVTKDGKPVAFAPFYCQMALAHLAFDGESQSADRLRALQMLLDGAVAFAVQYGVREIVTLSKENYPVAKWALANGFELDRRQVLKFDINKAMKVENEVSGEVEQGMVN